MHGSLHALKRCSSVPNPKFCCKDSYHYNNVLRSSIDSKTLKQTHAQIITFGHHHNPFLASNLVTRYAALGTDGLELARMVFDQTRQRDALFWNVMIREYSNSVSSSEAIHVYNQMRRSSVSPNCYTYPFVLKACGVMRDYGRGRAVHAHAVRDGLHLNIYVGNALIAFYGKCGGITAAKKVFDGTLSKDLVSWNSMIACYAQNNHARESIMLLHEMLRDGYGNKPDHFTLVALLPACASLAAIVEGVWIHLYAIKTGIKIDALLGSGLIGMYANCGRLALAREVFDRIVDKNVIVCNSMIRAYGTHGHASEALEIFKKMLETGVCPDGICFVSVLSACSHGGMVDKGWEVFRMMDEYGIEKDKVHYACMVDLLGRAGLLSDAVKFIKNMPVEPEKDVWGALLGACRVHNDLDLAEDVAKRLFILDPDNAGRYAVLAKMYEDAGRWKDAARLRKVMKDSGVRKPLGCSMVEVNSEFYMFGVEDESHLMAGEIYNVLEQLHKVVEDEDESDNCILNLSQ